MAGATFQLEIATPERLLLREQVEEAQIPAANGYLGILPQHAPLLAELGAGELTYKIDGRIHSLAVGGGWVEVLPGNTRVLATSAERANEINVQRAQESLRRAQERLENPSAGIDIARALNALKRAQARIAAAEHR